MTVVTKDDQLVTTRCQEWFAYWRKRMAYWALGTLSEQWRHQDA